MRQRAATCDRQPGRDGVANGCSGRLARDRVQGAEVDTAATPEVLDPVGVGAGLGTKQRAALARALSTGGNEEKSIDELRGPFFGLGGFEERRQGLGARRRCRQVFGPNPCCLAAQPADQDGDGTGCVRLVGLRNGCRFRSGAGLSRLVLCEPMGQVQEFESERSASKPPPDPSSGQESTSLVFGDPGRDRVDVLGRRPTPVRGLLQLLRQRFRAPFDPLRLP